MLFKPHGEVPTFHLEELFKTKDVASGLYKIEKPAALSLTPQKLYQRIKDIATKRFAYTLPEKQSELKSLATQTTKISLLRDLSIKLGVKL